ncbi:MAG: hypothetical protein ACK4GU_15380, partial [Alishewanella aestuarii]
TSQALPCINTSQTAAKTSSKRQHALAPPPLGDKLHSNFVLHHKIGGFAYLLWGKGLIIRAK